MLPCCSPSGSSPPVTCLPAVVPCHTAGGGLWPCATSQRCGTPAQQHSTADVASASAWCRAWLYCSRGVAAARHSSGEVRGRTGAGAGAAKAAGGATADRGAAATCRAAFRRRAVAATAALAAPSSQLRCMRFVTGAAWSCFLVVRPDSPPCWLSVAATASCNSRRLPLYGPGRVGRWDQIVMQQRALCATQRIPPYNRPLKQGCGAVGGLPALTMSAFLSWAALHLPRGRAGLLKPLHASGTQVWRPTHAEAKACQSKGGPAEPAPKHS